MIGSAPLRFLTPTGWETSTVQLSTSGRIQAFEARPYDAPYALPGIPNTHSHAFQRAMAGLSERQENPDDSFWTWRELMYRFASKLTPDALYNIASQLYVEMLEAGYTSVSEFHYLHHQPDGTPYSNAAAMSEAIIRAAADTGIRLTLLPVLYMSAGFDGRPLEPRQQRFGHSFDAFWQLIDTLKSQENDRLRIGVALHSLRAVPESIWPELMQRLENTTFPIHIHIAEQLAEVEQCVAVRKARPVEWLLDNATVDSRWTLVHATHLVDNEIQGIAKQGASVSICTTTEANLGDGLFPLHAFMQAGGQFSIGSDSHISVSPIEELRWLEYGQRLRAHRRNIAATEATPSVGETLLSHAWNAGQLGIGQAIGTLASNAFADIITLDSQAPVLVGAKDHDVLDRLIFAGNRSLIDEVYVAGQRRVSQGHHHAREKVAERYAVTLRRLLEE